MDKLFINKTSSGILLHVHLQPNAKNNRMIGLHGKRLKIAIQAPAIDGKANEALIKFMAEQLKISKNQIQIKSGDKSRQKTLVILGLSYEEVIARVSIPHKS